MPLPSGEDCLWQSEFPIRLELALAGTPSILCQWHKMLPRSDKRRARQNFSFWSFYSQFFEFPLRQTCLPGPQAFCLQNVAEDVCRVVPAMNLSISTVCEASIHKIKPVA